MWIHSMTFKRLFVLFLFIFGGFLGTAAFAHESPAPIPIQCGLQNDTTLQGEYVQFVTYAISPSILKKHFNLQDGEKTIGGYLKSFIPVDAVIKSGNELVQYSGSIMVALWEGKAGGSVEVFQFNKSIGGSSGNIYQKFPTKDSYEKSFENRIIRCRIYP